MLDKPKIDRPREKLARYGTARLSDLELLMAIIGSGNARADVGKIAREVLKIVRQKGGDISYDDLRSVVGLGEAKIPVILASLELARRYLLDSDQPIIDSPEKAVELLVDIRDKKAGIFCLPDAGWCKSFDRQAGGDHRHADRQPGAPARGLRRCHRRSRRQYHRGA